MIGWLGVILQQRAQERAARENERLARERTRRRRAELQAEFERIYRKHMSAGWRGDGSAGRT